MSKNQFLSKAALPIFCLGILLCAFVYIPAIRFGVGIDNTITLPFSNAVIFLIGGYMAGVGSMIFLSRVALSSFNQQSNVVSHKIKQPHFLGFSFYIPIPFLNFIIIYWFWRKNQSLGNARLELEYRKSLNFQITIYLFLLLSIFLVPILIGFLMVFLSLALHFISTLYVTLGNTEKSSINYPITINILNTDI